MNREFARFSLSLSPSPLLPTVTEKNASPLGDPPQQIAEELFMSVLRDDKEDTPLAFKFAYWLRVTCPAFFHLMMARRAEQATIAATAASIPQRF